MQMSGHMMKPVKIFLVLYSKCLCRGCGRTFLNIVTVKYYIIRTLACQLVFTAFYRNSYFINVNPQAGAVGPAASLSFASRICSISCGFMNPLPASINVPAIILISPKTM